MNSIMLLEDLKDQIEGRLFWRKCSYVIISADMMIDNQSILCNQKIKNLILEGHSYKNEWEVRNNFVDLFTKNFHYLFI